MKTVEFHKRAREAIRGFSKEVRLELGSALTKLQIGMTLGLPISRPMPDVSRGVHELRFRDAGGIQRVFYFMKTQRGVLVFHAFAKKTQKTPPNEIKIGRQRLAEMLTDEKD